MKKKLVIAFVSTTLLLGLASCDAFHTHSLVHHVAKPSTCYEEGNIEYWSCSDCGKRFKDAEGKQETLSVKEGKTNHSGVYHSEVASSCSSHGTIAHYECINCHHYFSDENCNNELETIEAPYENHVFTFVPQVNATLDSTGVMEHYVCDNCHGYFVLENENYIKKDLEDLIIDKLTPCVVTFNYDGYSSVTVGSGTTVNKPTDPVKENTAEYSYRFVEWKYQGIAFDFSKPITKDITLTPHFKKTPVNYTITFKCEGKSDVVKLFNCETIQSDFIEPTLEAKPGFDASWETYDLSKLENQVVNAVYTNNGLLLAKPSLEQGDGYTVKFKTVEHATTYEIKDDNDYRSSIVLNASDADNNGYLYYTPEVVGNHVISVTAKADGYIERESNTFKTLEVEPVFAYSPFASVLFYDNRENPVASDVPIYSLRMKDGTWTYVTQKEFDSTYIYNQGNIVDYTTEPYITNIVSLLKESGSNVINLGYRFNNVEIANTWWWGGSFAASTLKRTMDAAWKQGLKCIITDFTILHACVEENDYATIKSRLTCSGMRAAIKHPAFYGIELDDEPMPGDEMINTGTMVKSLLKAWHEDSEYSKMSDPFLHTDLCSFNTNKNSDPNADPYLFPTAQSYQDYLETWITNTGLDYMCFDYYTYTTYIYGQQSSLGKQYYYDSSKVIFDAVNNLRAKYPELTVHQTIVASNYKSRQTLSYQDVYASTLLSLSQGFYGYSIYTFFPESASQLNQCVDYDFNKTNTFTWVKSANGMYKYIKGLLNGYSLKSNEMSSYSHRFSLSDSGVGYGFDVRTSTSTFENASGNQMKMVVNYNTYATNTTTKVTVPKGTTYYYFGYNKELKPLISTGITLTLNNGEACLF